MSDSKTLGVVESRRDGGGNLDDKGTVPRPAYLHPGIPIDLLDAIQLGMSDAKMDPTYPVAKYIRSRVREFMADRFSVAYLDRDVEKLWAAIIREAK